jgi:hypothetical protein
MQYENLLKERKELALVTCVEAQKQLKAALKQTNGQEKYHDLICVIETCNRIVENC